jgi:hypothetical protein
MRGNGTNTLAAQSNLHMAKLSLRITTQAKPLQKLAEGQQVDRAEGRAPSGNPSKLVWGINVGQTG